MLSASPHYDKECLLAVTARVPLRLVKTEPVEPFPMGHEAGDHFSPCGQSVCWGGPRQPRIAHRRPARRSRWGRVLRSLFRFLMSPRAW